MYNKMIDLWERCTMREELNDCDHWPECEDCLLVDLRVVSLPKCWRIEEMDKDSIDDKLQLCQLLMAHNTGRCGRDCLFCEVERLGG